MRCKAKIEAGICGFVTEVTANSPDDQMVSLEIQSDCEKISALGEALKGKEIDGYAEIGAGFDGVVLTAARANLAGCCAGCAAPAGIFKALQVAARVALPKEVTISLESE
jgi:hypothetical protein